MIYPYEHINIFDVFIPLALLTPGITIWIIIIYTNGPWYLTKFWRIHNLILSHFIFVVSILMIANYSKHDYSYLWFFDLFLYFALFIVMIWTNAIPTEFVTDDENLATLWVYKNQRSYSKAKRKLNRPLEGLDFEIQNAVTKSVQKKLSELGYGLEISEFPDF